MLSLLLHAHCQHLAEHREEEMALCTDFAPHALVGQFFGAAQQQTLYLKAGVAGWLRGQGEAE